MSINDTLIEISTPQSRKITGYFSLRLGAHSAFTSSARVRVMHLAKTGYVRDILTREFLYRSEYSICTYVLKVGLCER